jgi:hypothetical protein
MVSGVLTPNAFPNSVIAGGFQSRFKQKLFLVDVVLSLIRMPHRFAYGRKRASHVRLRRRQGLGHLSRFLVHRCRAPQPGIYSGKFSPRGIVPRRDAQLEAARSEHPAH